MTSIGSSCSPRKRKRRSFARCEQGHPAAPGIARSDRAAADSSGNGEISWPINARTPTQREVDRLLASPHYGEKWARYWLDMAHYADSDGFEKDLVRPLGLALSRLGHQRVTTATCPMTVSSRCRSPAMRFRATSKIVSRRVSIARPSPIAKPASTGAKPASTNWWIAWALPAPFFSELRVRCSQCHDHKFDPIKQRDFYQMLAYFNAADETDIDAPVTGRNGLLSQGAADYERKRTELLEEYRIPELQKQWEADIVRAMDNPGK